jgi:hypothetical protein
VKQRNNSFCVVVLVATATACQSFVVPRLYPAESTPGIPVIDKRVNVNPPMIKVWDSSKHLLEKPDDREAARLVEDLRETSLFSAVVLRSPQTDTGTLQVFPDPTTRYCPSEPYLTVLTLGVFPDFTCATIGYHFRLSGNGLLHPINVDTRRQVPLVVGWIAPILNLLPNRSSQFPREVEVAELRKALLSGLPGGFP